jgi:hypothetical protein
MFDEKGEEKKTFLVISFFLLFHLLARRGLATAGSAASCPVMNGSWHSRGL